MRPADEEQLLFKSDIIEEILSRNGVEDSAGPIDLRIAASANAGGGNIDRRAMKQ